MAGAWAEKLFCTLSPGAQVELNDLCSGSGGPVPSLLDELEIRGCTASATLSDLYPTSTCTSHPRVSWFPRPLDAACIPKEFSGVRTMFSSFHHFRPEAARAILENAFRCRRTICVFEGASGTFAGMLTMLLVPLNVLAMMPFVRPFRWANVVLTYVIPVLPFIIFWDGVVSMLRIYSPEQMKSLTQGMQASDYSWDIGRLRVRGIPGGLPYLIGRGTS